MVSSISTATGVIGCLLWLMHLCQASTVSVGSSQYRLLSKGERTTRKMQTESPDLISFDGDLDAIKELALAKANQGSPGSFSCDNASTSHLEVVNWVYSIETVPQADVTTVYGEVEEMTLESVAPQALSCLNNQSAFANIVAMDIFDPGHEISNTETCRPELDSANVCTVIIGGIRTFLSNEESVGNATALVLQYVQKAYNDPSFIKNVGSGLLKINFLMLGDTDEGANTPPINDGESPNDGSQSDSADSGLTLSALLMVAIGSAAVVGIVVSVYIWRRGRDNSDEEGIHGSSATRLASLTINDTETFEPDDKDAGNNHPPSPYSEMVSNSYRFDKLAEMSILSSSNMSPVYELEGPETDTDTVTGAASVMISEGGYTTDAAGTDTEADSTNFESTAGGSKYSSSQSTAHVLGARPLPGTVGHIDMEEISDSDLDTSGEMSPVKMYVGTSLMNSNANKLLVLPSGRDPMDEENDDHDESLLLFGSPLPSSVTEVHRNMASVPSDETGDEESNIEGMSRLSSSPMSTNTAPSLPSF